MAVSGERVGDRYALVAELGAGGMGVVWRARDERLERDVAVKLLPAAAMGDPVARGRLLREARAAAQLRHAGIVHVYDVGELADGGAFLVMELVEGRSLRDLVDDDAATIPMRAAWVVEVAHALQHAHDGGIVHRDIKPDNVFVRTDGRAVLLDFGLAKPVPSALAATVAAGTPNAHLTAEGKVVGTPAYLAPEQVKGEALGPAADQFALATSAFELLTRELPWEGATAIEVVASMLRDAPKLAAARVPALPPAVDAVFARALAKSPAERFPSVTAFAEAFEAAVASAFGALPSHRTSLGQMAHASSDARLAAALTATAPVDAAVVTAPPASGAALRATTGSALTSSPSVAAPASRGATPSTLGRRAVFAAAGVVLVTAGALAWRGSRARHVQSATPPSPAVVLASAKVAACPPFRASGDDVVLPSAWLGAAAAALACDRVGARLGGEPARTLAPAELLPELPREPTEKVPWDPFDEKGAQERAEQEAKKRADVVLDGTLVRTPFEFQVEIVFRTQQGVEITRAKGHDMELYAAVSQAVRAAMPSGPASPFQRAWLDVGTTDAALDLLDFVNADLAEDPSDLVGRCRALEARKDIGRDMAYFVRARCHEATEHAPLAEPPPPVDASSLPALATTVAAQGSRGGPAAVHARAALLLDARSRAKSPAEAAILSATAADILFHGGDVSGARSAARTAVHDWPRLVDVRGTPYHRLAFSAEFDKGITEAHAIWLPFEPVAQQNAGAHGASLIAKVHLAQRAYLLGPRGYFGDAYGELLARVGRTERARGIAEQNDRDVLRVEALVGESKYKEAMDLANARVRAMTPDDRSSRAAFRLTAVAVEASLYTGADRSFVDDMVKRYVDVDPPFVSAGAVSYLDLIFSCVEAPQPVAKRCIRRLRDLYARGVPGAVIGSAPALLAGAERWADGDARGAAIAWRPLMLHAGAWLTVGIRHVLAECFTRTGMDELAVQLDADYIGLLEEPEAMDLAFVRAARRADKAGDRATAARFAGRALAKWRVADTDVPMMSEMQAIYTRSGGK